MHLVYSFLFLLNVQLPTKGDDNTFRKNDLLNVIKQNLKRNNDDYVEFLEKNKSFLSSTVVSTGSKDFTKFVQKISAKTELKNNTLDEKKSNRRANGDASWEFEYDEGKAPTSTSTKRRSDAVADDGPSKRSLRMRSDNKIAKFKFAHIKRNLSRLSDLHEIKLPNLKMSSNDTLPLNVNLEQILKSKNKKKINTFKKFMSKNKGLFELASGKLESQTKEHQLGGLKEVEVKELLKKNALRNIIKKVERAKDEDEGELPEPDLLDMAPAKGGRIHRLRVKGRLCARHVLLPEGPKYDSNGRWYVPEHRLVARHRYHVTPRPRLVLPRCCNCCKKSVLGCE